LESRSFAVRKRQRSEIWQINGTTNVSVIRNVWVEPVTSEIDKQSWVNRALTSGIGYEVCIAEDSWSGGSHGSSPSEVVRLEFVLLSSVHSVIFRHSLVFDLGFLLISIF